MRDSLSYIVTLSEKNIQAELIGNCQRISKKIKEILGIVIIVSSVVEHMHIKMALIRKRRGNFFLLALMFCLVMCDRVSL